jgi:hypothetical protein
MLISYDGVNQAILTVKSDGSLNYFPTETPISEKSTGTANPTTGALDLDFDEGGVIDNIFFLAGQGKRVGIYLDYNESDVLANVGVATEIANTAVVSEATISGETFVYYDEGKNEIVVLRYNADGTFEDFNNDCYVDGEQSACYYSANWSWIAEFELLEEVYSERESTPYKIADSGSSIYFAEQLAEGGETIKLSKTQAITAAAFTGSYTVDIPTENSRFNQLVIGENGDCEYEGTACDWTITDSGKAEITFDADPKAIGNVWQLAGSYSRFAFVMTHDGDANDIEPGLMTRD